MVWNGLVLSLVVLACVHSGGEIGTARGYSGTKKGIVLDAGDANNFTNVTFGLLDVCAQIGDSIHSMVPTLQHALIM